MQYGTQLGDPGWNSSRFIYYKHHPASQMKQTCCENVRGFQHHHLNFRFSLLYSHYDDVF